MNELFVKYAGLELVQGHCAHPVVAPGAYTERVLGVAGLAWLARSPHYALGHLTNYPPPRSDLTAARLGRARRGHRQQMSGPVRLKAREKRGGWQHREASDQTCWATGFFIHRVVGPRH
jgi:hypothetical protein